MHSEKYTLEDLLLNPQFVKWVKDPANEDRNFWNAWANESFENRQLYEEAREIIIGLAQDNDAPGGQELTDLLNRIRESNTLFDQQQQGKKHRPAILKFILSHRKMAAAFAGFLLISISSLFIFNKTGHETSYGQNKTITLPDGSVLILNANSTVSYASRWSATAPREVWLNGEGFFSVVHKKNNQQFIVHTSELDVQVLGTKFDVRNRRGSTRVILNSGKVRLSLAGNKKEVEMKPGDLVDFSSRTSALKKKKVTPVVYSSWTEKKLVFENTTLAEIGIMLEDNYGYKVKFLDEELTALTFTGTVDRGNIDLLLSILQKTFNISIVKKEGKITISS